MKRSFFLVSIFAALMASAGASGEELPPVSLDRLSELIAGAPNHTATFREERRQVLLSEPILLEGTLLYSAPDRLEKHTISPRREDLVVEGDWVTISAPDRDLNTRMKITADPVLYGLLFSLRAILAGDVAALDRRFTVAGRGRDDSWSIELQPRSGELAARIQSIKVAGAGGHVASIELLETTGDSFLIAIQIDE